MCAERRREMDKQLLPSIEKLAAFLDGNLSPDEMQQFSQLAEQNEALHQILAANAVIDEALSSYSETDLQLPSEILESSFSLPTIPSEMPSDLAPLTPEPRYNEFNEVAAAVASIDEEIQPFSEIDSADNDVSILSHSDDLINLTPENEDFNISDNPSAPDDF